MQKQSNKPERATAANKKGLNKKLTAIIAVAVSVVLVLAIVLPIVLLGNKWSAFKTPELSLPTEEKYALRRYGYDEMHDAQTTIRSDVMNVTKRGLPRAETSPLTNEFSLVYNKSENKLSAEYGIVNSTSNLATASITFNEDTYPDPYHGKGTPTNAYAAEAAAANVSVADYFSYYKYMFLTQSQHLSKEAARRAEATASDEAGVDPDFKAWLKKHPAADLQYGEVKGTDNAVEKEIILDPLYRSEHVTGLYLPAGEAITVKVEGLKKGERISVVLGSQDTLAWRGNIETSPANADIAELTGGSFTSVTYTDATSDNFFKKADLLTVAGKFYKYNQGDTTQFLQNQWKRQNARAPFLSAVFTLTENKTYTIGSVYGGHIQINMGNCYSEVKTTFTGAVETPHYILGVTSPEYFDEYLRQAPGIIAVMDTENGQLIGPTGEQGTTSYMRQIKTEEVDKLATLWHSFFTVNESFTGGIYNRFNKVMFDWHVPAGAAVALGGHTYACPTSWYNGSMNYRGLLRGGTWGVLHEIGHNHGAAYGSIWGFGTSREGEVRNNALTLLSYIISCDIGTTIRSGGSAEHGGYANPYTVLTETLRYKNREGDFDDGFYGYFACLGMYANIMHSFGADKYYELLYTYKDNPEYVTKRSGDSKNIYKRADFAYRCSLVYGMNFIKYFNTFYCANIPEDYFTEEQLSFMKALPNYEPVSNFYAGTIDGVKTAGDYEVAYGNDLTLDLLGKTISSLDTEDGKGFEIIAVGKPTHGKLTELGEGKWTYSFNPKYTGALDEFDFSIKLSDGVIHTFTVTLRISYNGLKIDTYKNITGRNWDAITAELETKLPDETASATGTYISNYNTAKGEWDAKIGKYYWRAPKSGNVRISAICDDWIRFYFGDSFETLEPIGQIDTYTSVYKDYGEPKAVEEGKYYAIQIVNVNGGGKGSAAVAFKYDGDESYALPANTDVYHPDIPLGKQVESYVFEPDYLISKKDSIKLSTTGTDKSEWTVLKAPTNVVGGQFYEESMTDETTGEVTNFTVDKWTWLIDGQAGTVLHTTYGGKDPKITPENPHEFIIDTARKQFFNFFTVTTRNNVNSYITDCELQISDSPDGGWKTVMEGTREMYKGTSLTMKFPQVEGRYLRLLVKGTTGGNFSVLAELDAGIQSTIQRILPPTSSLLFTTKAWVNSATVSTEPNGYIIAQKKNAKVVIKFHGESVALYAATGAGYGKIDIKIDGKLITTVDLNSNVEEARKLILNEESLKDKEHTVEIITKSADKVMLNLIGIPYSADLINAPNIYLERGLTIALVVFILLFAALVAFGVCLLLLPNFRNKVFGNKFVEKLDNREKKPKAEKKPKPEKPKAGKKPEPVKTEKPAEVKKTEAAKPEKPTEQAKKPAAKKPAAKEKPAATKPAADKSKPKK